MLSEEFLAAAEIEASAPITVGGGRSCANCGAHIPAERLELLPNTQYCVKCAVLFPPPPHDPEDVCAKASPSGQNGWSPSS